MTSLSSVFITFLFFFGFAVASGVVVETKQAGDGPTGTKDFRYTAHVTLYIEDTETKERTPSGWSTRKEDGASHDQPFAFQPGVNLIAGWTQGVLQMKEGERALLHVPSELNLWVVQAGLFTFRPIQIYCLILKFWANKSKSFDLRNDTLLGCCLYV